MWRGGRNCSSQPGIVLCNLVCQVQYARGTLSQSVGKIDINNSSGSRSLVVSHAQNTIIPNFALCFGNPKVGHHQPGDKQLTRAVVSNQFITVATIATTVATKVFSVATSSEF
jgi:hypothetical protein